MDVNPDFRDLFKTLNACRVKYMVIGAHAVVHYTEPRYTKDLDLWLEPSPENASKVFKALSLFGAPLQGVSQADFANPDLVYQVGIEPNRIDFMMGVEGLSFDSAWKNRVGTSFGGIRIYIMGREDLIRNKRATGRPQDLLDVRRLAGGSSSQTKSPRRPTPKRDQG